MNGTNIYLMFIDHSNWVRSIGKKIILPRGTLFYYIEVVI